MATAPRWTEAEDNVIKEMVKAKHDIDAMCSVLISRTKIAVKQRVNDLGLSLLLNKPEIDMEAFKRLMEGVK